MGECILAFGRYGYTSSEAIAEYLPVLNSNYPEDVTFKYNETGYNLSVLIDQYPSGCKYQWYKDNQPITGATSPIYNFIPDDIYATYNIFCVVSNSLGSVTSRTAIFTCYPSKLYIIQNALLNTSIVSKFSRSTSHGEMYSSPFQICTTSTSYAIYKSSNTIPVSMYNNMTIAYSINNSALMGGQIAYIGSSKTVLFNATSTVNKEVTIDKEINVSSNDYLYLSVASDGVNYTNVFYKEILLY